MKCPYCNTGINLSTEYFTEAHPIEEAKRTNYGFDVAFGFCPECKDVIILYRKGTYWQEMEAKWMNEVQEEEIVYPRLPSRRITSLDVPDSYRKDFNEASAVLILSPKASAAISRRLLQNILREEYKIEHRSLDLEIGEFIGRPDIPSYLAADVDAIRNIGNFASHPLKNTNTGEIIEVEPGEAEWLLDVLESLFDFTFIQHKKSETRREMLNEKLRSVGKPPMKTSKKST